MAKIFFIQLFQPDFLLILILFSICTYSP